MYPVEWFHHTRSELIITPLLNCSHGTLVIPHSPVPPMPPKLPSTMHCSQLCPLLPNTIPAFAPLYWLNINLASVAQVEWCTWCILVHTLLHSPVYLGAFWCRLVHSGTWWCILVYGGSFWCMVGALRWCSYPLLCPLLPRAARHTSRQQPVQVLAPDLAPVQVLAPDPAASASSSNRSNASASSSTKSSTRSSTSAF